MKTLAEKIVIQQGDLTDMDTDAIVNAANNDLHLGAGVAGAIRRKGGEEIQRECDDDREHTGGLCGDHLGRKTEGALCDSCGQHVARRKDERGIAAALGGAFLKIANERGLKTIAFPAVGTGIAGFPLKDCADIMIREAAKHLRGRNLSRDNLFRAFRRSCGRNLWACVEKNSGGARG